MPYLISTATGGRGYLSGNFWRANPLDFSDKVRAVAPPAVSAIAHKAAHKLYANRVYVGGHFTENLLYDEHYRLLRMGIRPPVSAPSVVLSSGGTEQILYLSFWDEKTGERSSLSAGTTLTGGLTRTWSNLPTSVPGEILRAEGVVAKTAGLPTVTGVGAPAKTNFDMFRPGDRVLFSSTPNRWTTIKSILSGSQMDVDDLGITAVADTLTFKAASRCSHVECWVSVAGTLPRLAARVRLGTTSFTEAVPTLSLGEAFLDNFDLMPSGTMNCVYGDRLLVAGVDRQRDTVFLSNLFRPEQNGGLSFRTRYGEAITGLIGADDYTLVLTAETSYILQGYTEDDLTMTVSNPSLGGFGHLTNVQIEANLWIPNRKNFWVYNGSWKPELMDRNTEWNDSYLANQIAFESGVTVYNPNDSTIQFYPAYGSGTLNRENIWVADFSSVKADAGGEYAQPMWLDDDHRAVGEGDTKQTGQQNVIAYWGHAAYLIPDGQSVGKMYRAQDSTSGGLQGMIYYEDPSVAYHRDAVLKTRHELYSDEAPEDAGGGNEFHGWKLDTLWLYVRSELTDWQAGVWAGDEYAATDIGPMGLFNVADLNIVGPQWPDTGALAAILASQANVNGNTTYKGQSIRYRRWAPKTVHFFQPKIDGRGHTIELRFPVPKGAQFLGFGGKVIPGKASRGLVDAEHFLG